LPKTKKTKNTKKLLALKSHKEIAKFRPEKPLLGVGGG
jgi:hypothetical protein